MGTDATLLLRHFALKYEPPTLLIEYEQKSQIRVRKIKFRPEDLTNKKRSVKVVDALIKKNSAFLGPDRVQREQIQEIVDMLFDRFSINNSTESSTNRNEGLGYSEKDKKTTISDNFNAKETSDILAGADATRVQQADLSSSSLPAAPTSLSPSPIPPSGGDNKELSNTGVSNGINLNTVSDFALKQAKCKMDVTFNQNAIPKDDPQFVWDKRIEFEAESDGDNSWDEGDEG